MNESDSDYDLRQIGLIEQQISQFTDGTITLPHLIAGLESLLGCLRTLGKDWKDRFKSEWWTLEQVYAVGLDRKKTIMSPEDLALIKEATCNLKALALAAKEQLHRKITVGDQFES